jgi:tetratricopeptide (TPR) repeat protein
MSGFLKFGCFIFLFLLGFFRLNAQNVNTDSLHDALKSSDDTTRIRIYLTLIEASNDENEWLPYNRQADAITKKLISQNSRSTNPRLNYFHSQVLNNYGYYYHVKGILDSAVHYYKHASDLLDKAGYKKDAVVMISNMAGIYYARGDGLPALAEYQKCLNIREEIRDSAGIARSHYHLGLCYKLLGQMKQASDHYYKSLTMFDKLKNEGGKADALNGIASLLDDQENYDMALKYYRESLTIYQRLKDINGMLTVWNNIGQIYANKKMSDSAIYYYKMVIKYRIENGYRQGLAFSYHNLATEYSTTGQEDLALIYFNKSYEISKNLGLPDGIAWACNGLAWSHYRQGQLKNAVVYTTEGVKIAEELSHPTLLKNLHEISYLIYEKLGDYRASHEHYKKFKLYEDSLVNLTNKEAALKGQMQYEFDKKELLLKSENERYSLLQKQEISRQRWIIFTVIGGLLITLIFSFFLFSRFKIIKRQKKIIEHQKEIVEEKQKEVLDSIQYAKRIQQSLLPNERFISRILKDLKK